MFLVSMAAPFTASLFECLTSLRATPFTFQWLTPFEWLMPFEDSIVETLRATSRNISDVVGAYNVLWISAICKLFILNNAN